MALPFLVPNPITTSVHAGPLQERVALTAGLEDNPFVYARILHTLLDVGELTTGHLRGILDRVGAQECPIGSYVAMAQYRADAVRLDERLVATAGATQRASLTQDTMRVALSDPSYRDHISSLLEPPTSPEGLRKLQQTSQRYLAWDVALFGVRLDVKNAGSCLDARFPGRSLSSIAVATEGGDPLPITEAPFVECIGTAGLPVAFPGHLTQLLGGVGVVNKALERVRTQPAGVRVPTPVDPVCRVHGGLLHPGEAPPRAIPDNLSLRLRALTHTPLVALWGALLMLDRSSQEPFAILEHQGDVRLRWRQTDMGAVMDLLSTFVRDQGWNLFRTGHTPLAGPAAVHLLEGLGVATRIGHRIVLDEALFLRLQEDPEAQLVFEALAPLEDRIHAWLSELRSPVSPQG
jgi:hypothetical protein